MDFFFSVDRLEKLYNHDFTYHIGNLYEFIRLVLICLVLRKVLISFPHVRDYRMFGSLDDSCVSLYFTATWNHSRWVLAFA